MSTAISPTCARSSPPASAAPSDWSKPRAMYGAEVIAAYMGHVLANAEEAVRRLIDRLDDGAFDYRDGQWRDGPRRDQRRQGGAIGDVRFHRHQRPAARQFQRAALDRPRGGALCRAHPDRRRDPDERRLPAADPADRPRRVDAQPALIPAAVVAGNVETSQVVTDALFAATGRLAPSQGTMNNLTFGNERLPIL